mgnify:CR=1 FL=1
MALHRAIFFICLLNLELKSCKKMICSSTGPSPSLKNAIRNLMENDLELLSYFHHFLNRNNHNGIEILSGKTQEEKFVHFCLEALFAFFFSKVISRKMRYIIVKLLTEIFNITF